MSKKLLVISSSPRIHGNSDRLCDQFILGAIAAGHQSEKINLQGLNIAYCSGCGVCFKTHVCSQRDDMDGLLAKMIECDVLVLATPVYFYNMTAQLKTLIDRTTPRYNDLKNKDIYLIATMADSGNSSMERTFDGIRGFTELLPGSKEKGLIFGHSAWKIGDIDKTEAIKIAYDMGKGI